MFTDPKPGTLIQLGDSETGIRNRVCEGHFDQLPAAGKGFMFVGKALDTGADLRFIHTSRVEKILSIEPGKVSFMTENTTYRLEYTVN